MEKENILFIAEKKKRRRRNIFGQGKYTFVEVKKTEEKRRKILGKGKYILCGDVGGV